jgi:predicted glutamine amidotransferase
VLWALGQARQEMRRHGIAEPLRFAAALSDGRSLHVFRLSSDATPPSLFMRRHGDGVTIASEPLSETESALGEGVGASEVGGSPWEALPAGAVLTIEGSEVQRRTETLM